jgi:hypothetical protein
VQGRDAAGIPTIRIAAGTDQILNDRSLGRGVPTGRARHAIDRVVERLRTSAVSCANIGSPSDELPSNVCLVGSRRDV